MSGAPAEPPADRPKPTFQTLQEWEGYVVDIGETEFTARLLDLTAQSLVEDEEALIPLAELSESDAARMREGSIFRWVIGYRRWPSGQQERVSSIVFPDKPVLTRADLAEGEAWVRQVTAAFGCERGD